MLQPIFFRRIYTAAPSLKSSVVEMKKIPRRSDTLEHYSLSALRQDSFVQLRSSPEPP